MASTSIPTQTVTLTLPDGATIAVAVEATHTMGAYQNVPKVKTETWNTPSGSTVVKFAPTYTPSSPPVPLGPPTIFTVTVAVPRQ